MQSQIDPQTAFLVCLFVGFIMIAMLDNDGGPRTPSGRMRLR